MDGSSRPAPHGSGRRLNTPERLLEAVDAVIAEHGPAGVTLRRVGSAAGLSHTAAAHYYRDKPGLFTAYITRAWEQVADRLEAVVAPASPDEGPDEPLIRAGLTFAEFALANPSAFSVMSRMELTNVDTPELWAARERGFFTLFALIEERQALGWATDREPLDLVATTWAFVHGFIDLWVGGPLWAPYDGNELIPTLRRLLERLLEDVGRS